MPPRCPTTQDAFGTPFSELHLVNLPAKIRKLFPCPQQEGRERQRAQAARGETIPPQAPARPPLHALPRQCPSHLTYA